MSQNVFLQKQKEKESPMKNITVLDIDLAKMFSNCMKLMSKGKKD
jgi:hypothetical protein